MVQANQTYGQAFGGGLNDILLKLISLSQSGSPADAGVRTGMAAMNTQVGQNPAGDMGKAALGPYAEGVQKALKKGGEAHAAEALSMGVPPQHIEQQAGLTPPPAAPMPMAGPTPQQSAQPQGTQNAPAGHQDTLGILNQLGKFLFNPGGIDPTNGAAQAPSLLGGLIQNRNPQDMLARQQATNAIPGQQVALKKAEAEQVPPTQYEQKALQAGGYAAQVKAIDDEITRIQADKANVIDQMKTALETRNPGEKFFGAKGGEVKKLQDTLTALNKKEQEVHQKMFTIFNKQPNFKPKPNADPAAIAEAKRRGLI